MFCFCSEHVTFCLHLQLSLPLCTSSALWCVIEREAVGGCGAATGKAVLRSRQSGLCNSHYHREQRKCFRLMLERFCLPCRRMMMEMIAGCVRFETFLMSVICWTCLDVTWICSIWYKTLIFFDLIKMTEVGCSCIFLWCFCNIRAGSLSHLDFVPAAVPGLSCMAALGTKAKWLCSAHKRVFLLVFTRLQLYFTHHELSLRIPVWETLTLAEFPSFWFRDCPSARRR